MLRKMRAGQTQAALLSGSGMGFLDEGVSALQVPLMFDSLDEFDYVLDKLAPTLERRLHDEGFTALGWGDTGWACLFAVREFRTPKQPREMKLYTSKGDDDMIRLFGEFGFRAIPFDRTANQPRDGIGGCLRRAPADYSRLPVARLGTEHAQHALRPDLGTRYRPASGGA